MTKQEEIREWLVLCLAIQRGTIHGKLPDDKQVAQSILEGLHSQGVVIKVGKYQVLPDRIYINEDNKDFELSLSARTQTDMLNAGYVAVEPLIKEVN